MVYLFKVCDEGRNFAIYAPESKEENVKMIMYSFPTDLWVHIDGSKYLPVYLRQCDLDAKAQLDIDGIPSVALMSCGQIMKHFAKTKRDVLLTYTFVDNLSPNGPLDASRTRNRTSKTTKTSPVADLQLLATQEQIKIDFEAERLIYDSQQQKQNSEHFRKQQKAEKESSRQYRKLAEQNRRGYTDFFEEETVQQASNQNRTEDWEDDFM